MAANSPEQPSDGALADGSGDQDAVLRRAVPPFLSKLKYASFMYGLQSMLAPMVWIRDWKESRYPADGRPDFIKTYECRPGLPVR